MLLPLGMALSACDKGLEEINRNPNASESVSPEFLLSSVLINTAYDYQREAYWEEPASAGRYITLVRNEDNDKFDWGPRGWDSYYARLSANREMMEIAGTMNQPEYIAVGKVLEAFNFAYITDLYGDIPYSEALLSKNEGIVHPRYDRQQDIYPALLNTLKEANNELSLLSRTVDATADPMYKGDALKWRKLANSLRLRMLLRISKNYAPAFSVMQEILNEPLKYPVFENNEDNAEIGYPGDIGVNSWPGGPLANAFAEFDKRKPSKEIVDALAERDDPRMEVWIAPVDDPNGGRMYMDDYVGVPNAIPAPYDYNGGSPHISRLSPMFNSNSHPMLKASLMTYTELCFILAEAVQAGRVTVAGKTAESLYYEAIRSSMRYYNVEGVADIRDYYNLPGVQYDGTREQLITQKWIALFLKGPEGWFDHRRTGFPQFTLGPLAASAVIPKRFIFPDTERAYNEKQYQQALVQFGEDRAGTLMWYLK
ncbi:SusD/RagB family nutrient-binding outer membrane lipoprotein [Chitinophaga barathri]|nr:SusD/RagB family nutrient-binding outer membrane lipoprotein [Chitinophaga barathri]